MNPISRGGLAPSRQRLENGLVVIAKSARTSPAVTISLAVRAGSAREQDDRAGLAHFLSRVIDRGTATRTATAIADQLDAAGVTLSASATRHQFTVSCTCLAEAVDPILDLVADVVSHPILPESEIETRRGEIITAIRQDDDNPAMAAIEGLFALLYPPPHPYGRRLKGRVETIERIDRAALAGFHQAHIEPAGASLAIVGDLEEPRAIDAAARAFGGWGREGATGTPAPDQVDDPPEPGQRRQQAIVLGGKAQTDITYGFVTIRRHDPAYYDCWVMNNILGQYALGGRLGDNIRERQGMAYYAFSVFEPSLGAGPLVVRAGVNPANVERTIAAIDDEIRRMADHGITEKELSETRRYLIGSIPRQFETNAGIAAFLQNVEFFNLGLDFDTRLPSLISQVTVAGANEVARRFLAPERASIVIAGPPAPGA